MRLHTKFRVNRSIFREVMADVSYIFKMASVRHLEFCKKNLILDKFSRAESKSASARQIWSKSDDRRLRYCDKTEIQYCRRRHVEFTSGLLFDTF